MHRLLILTVVALLAAQPFAARAQPAARPGTAEPVAENSALPYVVALGAIAGVVVFNVAALGIEALPGGMAYAGAATVPAEMSVAMSRVYAATSAGHLDASRKAQDGLRPAAPYSTLTSCTSTSGAATAGKLAASIAPAAFVELPGGLMP